MSPDRRERILLLVLVGLVLVGGIYYSGSLLSSWQYVYELASESETSSVKRDDKILENPASVRDSVLRRYQNNLADFAGIPLAEVLWGAQGWSGSLDVALRNGSGTDPQGSFEGVFQGTVFFGGLVEGTLRSKSDSWTIRARENSLYVVGDSNQKFQLADVHFRDPAPFSIQLDFLKEATLRDVTSKNWRGQAVYVLSVDVDRGSGRLFVTREEPHRILEFILESDSTWTRQFDYADRKSDRLMAIRTYRNQNFISSYYQSDGETRTLEYRSRRSGSPGEVMRLNYKPAGDTLNIHLEYNRSLGEEPFLSGSGSLETSSDQLTSLAIESTLIPSSGSTTPIRLNVHADELAQEGNQEQQNVQNPRSFENISPRKFIEILLSDSAVKPPSDVPESTVVQTTDADTNSGEIMSENRLSPDTQSDPIPHSDTSLGKDGSRGPKETTNRTDDWPEAPKRSGETIVRSSADGYPRSVPPTGFARARRHYESGELNRAAAVLEDLAETYPKSVNVPFLLGVIEYERDQPGKAAQYFRAVIQMEHDPQLRDWSRIYLRLLGSQDEGS